VLVQVNTSAIAKLKRCFALFLITIDFGTSQISTQIRAFRVITTSITTIRQLLPLFLSRATCLYYVAADPRSSMRALKGLGSRPISKLALSFSFMCNSGGLK